MRGLPSRRLVRSFQRSELGIYLLNLANPDEQESLNSKHEAIVMLSAGTDHPVAHLYDVNTFKCYLSSALQEGHVGGAINQVRNVLGFSSRSIAETDASMFHLEAGTIRSKWGDVRHGQQGWGCAHLGRR